MKKGSLTILVFIALFYLSGITASSASVELPDYSDFKKTNMESNIAREISAKTNSLHLYKTNRTEEKIRVVIESPNNTKILDQNLVESRYGNLLQASISFNELNKIHQSNECKYIRKPLPVFPLTISEGVEVINATPLHDMNIKGDGVKVAIIDIGFADLNREVWNVKELKSFRADNSLEKDVHGTACAEIVLDSAPNASLYLYTVGTDVELLNAINYSISKEVDIISMSLGLLNAGGYDGTGRVCEMVNAARNAGIVFVSAAGNYANYHYEGNFSDEDHNGYHNFSGNDEVLELGNLSSGEPIDLYLSWNDWPYSSQDYDMFLVRMNNAGEWEVCDYSVNSQTGTQPPVEKIHYIAQGSEKWGIMISKENATRKVHFDLFTLKTTPEYSIKESSIVIPADASGALAVGASYWNDDSLENFSSRGPTNDGRTKPDVVAPDGVSTLSYGSFYGTSASTPHVAGAAALLLDLKPFTPNEIKTLLQRNALDLGVKGKDNLYGAGRIDLWKAYEYARTIYVPDNYTKIQWAVDNATAGDRIIIRNGTYYENVNVSKHITLVGENNPIVDARGKGSAVLLSSDNIRIKGITVTNTSGYPNGGIKAISDNNIISNVTAKNNYYGVFLYKSRNNTIENNNVIESKYYGVYLYNSSHNNEVLGNKVENNKYGIRLSYSKNNTVNDNKVCNNSKGIYLKFPNHNNILTGNTVSGSEYGIDLSDGSKNAFKGNKLFNNLWDIHISSAPDNVFTNNSLNPFTNISFTYSGNLLVRNASPLPNPEGYFNISKFVEVEFLPSSSTGEWLYLNFSYSDDVGEVDESSLKIWKYNGTWYENGWYSSSFLDRDTNQVGANTTSSGIFAPLGEKSGSKGDFDGNCNINFNDFMEFAAVYNTNCSSPNYDSVADFDDDCDVDFYDFMDFAAIYNTDVC